MNTLHWQPVYTAVKWDTLLQMESWTLLRLVGFVLLSLPSLAQAHQTD